ncbi:MAG: insulinase family protein [Caulobacteraceae bacterium]|nr:insulinase family protein [Caulobacteraceae bacterium]
MLRIMLAAVLAAVVLGTGRQAAAQSVVPPIGFHARTLANGLRVITALDRTTPNVTVQVWYGVGAKNDPSGRSGFAHLFEHMMFKATAQLPAEYFDRLTEDVGGMNNAFTMDDTTAFYEVIPSGHLQRLLWAEASRMSSLQVDAANFHSEREVVKEELRQRVLADPYGRFFRYLIPEATFAVHPYKRSAIGSIEDLDAATLDDVRAFHATFYRPDNAVLVVAGNFDPAELDAWIDRYFGALRDPPPPVPAVAAVEPPRTAPRTVTGYGPDVPLPAVAITWLAPAAASPDAAPLDVLDAILTAGRSSRLYDSLIYERQVAAQVFSEADLRQQPGMFYVGAVAAQGHTADELLTALRDQVGALRRTPVSSAELEAAKTQLLATEVRQRETIEGRATELGQAQVIEGDAARANTDIEDLQKVTAADVLRVARQYLPDEQRVDIRYLPESQKPQTTPGATAPPASAAPAAEASPETAPEPTAAAPSPPAGLPPIGAQPAPVLPTPAEKTLANGLRVIVARSTDLPLVAADLLVQTGSEADPPGLSGAAILTADVVTEGTTSRSARDIARQTEILGAQLNASASWEASSVSLSAMRGKLEAALPIMADVVENPTFAADEVERARKQALAGLEVALGDPAQVAAFATAPVVYAGTPFGHAANGDRGSLKRLTAADLARFHAAYWRPDNAILVLTGDISAEDGFALAQKVFGAWKRPAGPPPRPPAAKADARPRTVAVDLPGAGQAAVVVTLPTITRRDPRYYQGLVANTVLGGGYSARLNEEIRVKRGLSYGAGAQLSARRTLGAFTAQAQTRNETAGEVANLIKDEMRKLAGAPPAQGELTARTSSLVGEYGRALATAGGLGAQLGALALYGIDLDEIKAYTGKVEAVTPGEVQAFARDALDPDRASVIVVGDGQTALAPLKAAFPNLAVVPIARFDPDNPSLEGPAP